MKITEKQFKLWFYERNYTDAQINIVQNVTMSSFQWSSYKDKSLKSFS